MMFAALGDSSRPPTSNTSYDCRHGEKLIQQNEWQPRVDKLPLAYPQTLYVRHILLKLLLHHFQYTTNRGSGLHSSFIATPHLSANNRIVCRRLNIEACLVSRHNYMMWLVRSGGPIASLLLTLPPSNVQLQDATGVARFATTSQASELATTYGQDQCHVQVLAHLLQKH